MSHRDTRVVFVGNIPYDISEEQLKNVFSEVGSVVEVRLVTERDTGKFKGYGFCEFEDPETAASAVRNLNEVEVGGRPLRLDFAEQDPMSEGGERRGDSGAGSRAGLPPLPPGIALPPGVPSADAISQTIASLPPNQLLDILTQMKSLAASSPDQARALLGGNPQLTYALFQAMLMMNVVDPAVVQRVLNSSGGMPPPPGAGMPGPPPGGMPGPGGMPPPPPGAAPPGGPPPPAGLPPNLDEQQRQLLMQVLQLTPEQINALPPDQRASILQLKAQFGQ